MASYDHGQEKEITGSKDKPMNSVIKELECVVADLGKLIEHVCGVVATVAKPSKPSIENEKCREAIGESELVRCIGSVNYKLHCQKDILNSLLDRIEI